MKKKLTISDLSTIIEKVIIVKLKKNNRELLINYLKKF